MPKRTHESGRRTAHAVHANLNKELEEVWKWFCENKMILNPEKCKALVLAREPNAGDLLKVLPYRLVTIFRDMFGLTLDDSLTFVKLVRKISTEESWKAARCSLLRPYTTII